MNGIRNSVRLIGNLGAAPELKDLDKGTKMARVNIATTDYYTDKKGEKQKETQWHTLVAWGKTAELMIELTDALTRKMERKSTSLRWLCKNSQYWGSELPLPKSSHNLFATILKRTIAKYFPLAYTLETSLA